MTAQRYLEDNKPNIIYNYNKRKQEDSQYLWEESKFYTILMTIIEELYPLRNNQEQTNQYLNLRLGQAQRYQRYYSDKRDDELNHFSTPPLILHLEGEIPQQYIQLAKSTLVTAFQIDKSYGYAYFNLACEFNRLDPYWTPYPNCIPKTEDITFHIKYCFNTIERELEGLSIKGKLLFITKVKSDCLKDNQYASDLKAEFIDWCENEKKYILELHEIMKLEEENKDENNSSQRQVIQALCKDNTSVSLIDTFLKTGFVNKQLKIKSTTTSMQIICSIIPLINQGYFRTINKDSSNTQKVSFIMANIDGIKEKTLLNTLTEYNKST